MNTSKMNESDIWDEYKYRHDLIWRKVHQFTIIMVSLGIAPHVELNIGTTGKEFIRFLPIIGTLFGFFGAFVLNNEPKLFRKIKTVHREMQNDTIRDHFKDKFGSKVPIPFHDPIDRGRISLFLDIYYTAILSLSGFNCIILL